MSLLRSRRTRLGLIAVLVLLGLLGLTRDFLASPRSSVRGALTRLAASPDLEIRVLLDLSLDSKKAPRQRFHRLKFLGGPGTLTRGSAGGPAFLLPFRLHLARRGVTVTFRGGTLHRDRTWYLRLTELPEFRGLERALGGRWLQLGDARPQDQPPLFTAADWTSLANRLLARDVVRAVQRRPRERVRTLRARKYQLQVESDRVQNLARELQGAVTDRPALVSALSFLEQRLNEYRIGKVELWIHPRTRQLVRARVEFVPKTEQAVANFFIADVTVFSKSGGNVPASPTNAVRVRPELFQRLFAP